MKQYLNLRTNIAKGLILAFLLNSFGPLPMAQADQWLLPQPGMMVPLSPEFTPAILKGIVIHPENAFKYDFIIYKGDKALPAAQKTEEYTKLIKYFLASLAVPDEDQWVNLSPYEHNRIIKDDFGKTTMGRDLLAQDYLLKQITASLIYPQDKIGQQFWNEVYVQAYKKFGTTNIPVNTFNKVWIIPDEANIYEKGNIAYLYKSHLKVMLEEDYLSLQKHSAISAVIPAKTGIHNIASQIVREIVIPQLEKEVNQDKNFAPLRQVFSGMILAAWYKRALRESLLGKIYANKIKVRGVDQDPENNEAIYQQYLRAYKKGVFNYIKQDIDQNTHQTIPRKYFSGGATAAKWGDGTNGVLMVYHEGNQSAAMAAELALGQDKAEASYDLAQATVDPAANMVKEASVAASLPSAAMKATSLRSILLKTILALGMGFMLSPALEAQDIPTPAQPARSATVLDDFKMIPIQTEKGKVYGVGQWHADALSLNKFLNSLKDDNEDSFRGVVETFLAENKAILQSYDKEILALKELIESGKITLISYEGGDRDLDMKRPLTEQYMRIKGKMAKLKLDDRTDDLIKLVFKPSVYLYLTAQPDSSLDKAFRKIVIRSFDSKTLIGLSLGKFKELGKPDDYTDKDLLGISLGERNLFIALGTLQAPAGDKIIEEGVAHFADNSGVATLQNLLQHMSDLTGKKDPRVWTDQEDIVRFINQDKVLQAKLGEVTTGEVNSWIDKGIEFEPLEAMAKRSLGYLKYANNVRALFVYRGDKPVGFGEMQKVALIPEKGVILIDANELKAMPRDQQLEYLILWIAYAAQVNADPSKSLPEREIQATITHIELFMKIHYGEDIAQWNNNVDNLRYIKTNLPKISAAFPSEYKELDYFDNTIDGRGALTIRFLNKDKLMFRSVTINPGNAMTVKSSSLKSAAMLGSTRRSVLFSAAYLFKTSAQGKLSLVNSITPSLDQNSLDQRVRRIQLGFEALSSTYRGNTNVMILIRYLEKVMELALQHSAISVIADIEKIIGILKSLPTSEALQNNQSYQDSLLRVAEAYSEFSAAMTARVNISYSDGKGVWGKKWKNSSQDIRWFYNPRYRSLGITIGNKSYSLATLNRNPSNTIPAILENKDVWGTARRMYFGNVSKRNPQQDLRSLANYVAEKINSNPMQQKRLQASAAMSVLKLIDKAHQLAQKFFMYYRMYDPHPKSEDPQYRISSEERLSWRMAWLKDFPKIITFPCFITFGAWMFNHHMMAQLEHFPYEQLRLHLADAQFVLRYTIASSINYLRNVTLFWWVYSNLIHFTQVGGVSTLPAAWMRLDQANEIWNRNELRFLRKLIRSRIGNVDKEGSNVIGRSASAAVDELYSAKSYEAREAKFNELIEKAAVDEEGAKAPEQVEKVTTRQFLAAAAGLAAIATPPAYLINKYVLSPRARVEHLISEFNHYFLKEDQLSLFSLETLSELEGAYLNNSFNDADAQARAFYFFRYMDEATVDKLIQSYEQGNTKVQSILDLIEICNNRYARKINPAATDLQLNFESLVLVYESSMQENGKEVLFEIIQASIARLIIEANDQNLDKEIRIRARRTLNFTHPDYLINRRSDKKIRRLLEILSVWNKDAADALRLGVISNPPHQGHGPLANVVEPTNQSDTSAAMAVQTTREFMALDQEDRGYVLFNMEQSQRRTLKLRIGQTLDVARGKIALMSPEEQGEGLVQIGKDEYKIDDLLVALKAVGASIDRYEQDQKDDELIKELDNKIILNRRTGQIRPAFPGQPIVRLSFTFLAERHGQAIANVEDRMHGGTHDKDVNQLTDKGIEGAQVGAVLLMNRPEIQAAIRSQKSIVVITSPKKRTKDTAKPWIEVFTKAGGKIEIARERFIYWANEIVFGDLDNKSESEMTPDELVLVKKYREGLDATVKFNRGESFIQFLIRVKSWLDDLNKEYPGRTIILFGHGTFISAVKILLGYPEMVDMADDGHTFYNWRGHGQMIPNSTPVLLSSNRAMIGSNLTPDEKAQLSKARSVDQQLLTSSALVLSLGALRIPSNNKLMLYLYNLGAQQMTLEQYSIKTHIIDHIGSYVTLLIGIWWASNVINRERKLNKIDTLKDLWKRLDGIIFSRLELQAMRQIIKKRAYTTGFALREAAGQVVDELEGEGITIEDRKTRIVQLYAKAGIDLKKFVVVSRSAAMIVRSTHDLMAIDPDQWTDDLSEMGEQELRSLKLRVGNSLSLARAGTGQYSVEELTAALGAFNTAIDNPSRAMTHWSKSYPGAQLPRRLVIQRGLAALGVLALQPGNPVHRGVEIMTEGLEQGVPLNFISSQMGSAQLMHFFEYCGSLSERVDFAMRNPLRPYSLAPVIFWLASLVAHAKVDFTKGGIDFNAAYLNFHIKRDGNGVPLPVSQQDLENIHIDGLVPRILKIIPAAASGVLSQLVAPSSGLSLR